MKEKVDQYLGEMTGEELMIIIDSRWRVYASSSYCFVY